MSDFVIMMSQYKQLLVTQNRNLYVGENYADQFAIIVPTTYGDYDLTTFTAVLQYVDANNNSYVDILTADEDLYKENYIRYTLPIKSNLTHTAGKLKLQVVLTKVDSEKLVQYVINSSELEIEIKSHADYYKFSDDSLEAMTTLIGNLDAKIDYIENATVKLATKVPDDLAYDDSGNLHLAVGTTLLGEGKGVGTITVTDDEDTDNSDGVINLNDIYKEVDL